MKIMSLHTPSFKLSLIWQRSQNIYKINKPFLYEIDYLQFVTIVMRQIYIFKVLDMVNFDTRIKPSLRYNKMPS